VPLEASSLQRSYCDGVPLEASSLQRSYCDGSFAYCLLQIADYQLPRRRKARSLSHRDGVPLEASSLQRSYCDGSFAYCLLQIADYRDGAKLVAHSSQPLSSRRRAA